MSATIISGKLLQQALVAPALAEAVGAGVEPAVSLVSIDWGDPMLAVNRALHLRTLSAYGFVCDNIVLPADATPQELYDVIERLNVDDDVHGIMVLLPLPDGISIKDVLPRIAVEKELEGLHPRHASSLLTSNRSEQHAVKPLVNEAILYSLAQHGIPLERRNIVVLTEEGLMQSNPVANMVVRCAAPSMLPLSSPLSIVPIGHPSARTIAASADILIVSVEQAQVVTADWIKPGATVIDFNPSIIGFHPPEGDLAGVPILSGGIVTDDVSTVAGFVMPIPGGAGPVMLGMLMRNAAHAAVRASRRSVVTAP